jgi:hypothetical protein
MGMPEQQIMIEVVEKAPNYWWLLTIAIIPVIVGAVMTRRKK